MPTILLKKSDTPGSVPGTANLTNLAGGVEVAVNTADKRVYSMTSASAVIELGTNPSSLTCSDVSATVLRAGSATITNLLATTLTVSGGTANGVLYLNGSKVATSGSALTFDGTSFVAGVSAGAGQHIFRTYTSGGFAAIYNGAVTPGSTNYSFVTNATQTTLNAATFISGEISGTEAMRLTSTSLYTASGINVGIGTSSPSYKLDVVNSANANTTIGVTNSTSGTSALARFLAVSNAGNGWFGMTSPGYTDISSAADALVINASSASGGIVLAQDGVGQAWLNTSGNLGLGVTPSAWASTYKAFQITPRAALSANSSGDTLLTANAYNDGAWKYIATAASTAYVQSAGSHVFYNAPSGTINTAISFTQAMTLDANSNLQLGTTSNLGSVSRLTVQVDGSYGAVSFARNTDNAFAVATDYYKSRGSAGSPTVVQNGDGLYQLRVVPYQGSAYTYLNTMVVEVDGTFTAGQNPPTRIIWNTNTANGSATERARITSGGIFQINTTASIASNYKFITKTGTDMNLAISEQANQLAIEAANDSLSANVPLRIYASPLYVLSGETIVGGTTDNGAYNLQCNGTGVWGAGAYVNGSDARLKDDIQSLDSCLDVVNALRPVTFRYKPEHSKDQSVQTGFIAQELQQTLASKPYLEGLVQEGPEHLNVAYQNIIPLLTKAIQEQQAMINDLKAKVAALESK